VVAIGLVDAGTGLVGLSTLFAVVAANLDSQENFIMISEVKLTFISFLINSL